MGYTNGGEERGGDYLYEQPQPTTKTYDIYQGPCLPVGLLLQIRGTTWSSSRQDNRWRSQSIFLVMRSGPETTSPIPYDTKISDHWHDGAQIGCHTANGGGVRSDDHDDYMSRSEEWEGQGGNSTRYVDT